MVDVRDVCNLGDEDLAARRERLRRELAPHARAREALPDGVALRFDATSEMRKALEAFVAFERGCCSGLDFALHERGEVLQLAIRGIASDAAILAELGAPEAGDEP
jgi:hypothetical protein